MKCLCLAITKSCSCLFTAYTGCMVYGMNTQESQPAVQKTFKRNGHINYFLRCLRALPTQAQDNDSNRSVTSVSDIWELTGRMTIAFFCLSGLDMLGALDDMTTIEQREGWIEWIWKLQSRKICPQEIAEDRIWRI